MEEFNGTDYIDMVELNDAALLNYDVGNLTIFLNGSDERCNVDVREQAVMEDMKREVTWWSEYFLQTIVGVAGLLANTIAIPVLNTKEVLCTCCVP